MCGESRALPERRRPGWVRQSGALYTRMETPPGQLSVRHRVHGATQCATTSITTVGEPVRPSLFRPLMETQQRNDALQTDDMCVVV